jgi:hypothetical protein
MKRPDSLFISQEEAIARAVTRALYGVPKDGLSPKQLALAETESADALPTSVLTQGGSER